MRLSREQKDGGDMNEKDQVRRIFAVKRPGYDIEATGLLRDLRDNLGLSGIRAIRIYNRYDVSGITNEQYALARTRVFAEPPVDKIFDEHCDFGCPDAVFAVESLPGQYDQRADSAAQCIQILTCEERPLCKTARVYAFDGDLAAGGLPAISITRRILLHCCSSVRMLPSSVDAKPH